MDSNIWNGRWDGDEPLYHRFFQRIKREKNIENISTKDFVLQGFAVDEGVRRNKGRTGAKNAPDIIRKNMSNFPIVNADFNLFDFGNVFCENKNLELTTGKLDIFFLIIFGASSAPTLPLLRFTPSSTAKPCKTKSLGLIVS